MKSSTFRNEELFLRKKFDKAGKYTFPLIKKQKLVKGKINLLACSDTKIDEQSIYKKYFKGVY